MSNFLSGNVSAKPYEKFTVELKKSNFEVINVKPWLTLIAELSKNNESSTYALEERSRIKFYPPVFFLNWHDKNCKDLGKEL